MIPVRLIVAAAIVAVAATAVAHFSREDREYRARRESFETCVDAATSVDDIRRCDLKVYR